MKKLFLFMTFMMVCSLSSWAQTAFDSYLNLANHASIGEAYSQSTPINEIVKLYEYTQYQDAGVAWLTMPVYSAYRNSADITRYGVSSKTYKQEWIKVITPTDIVHPIFNDARYKWPTTSGENSTRSATSPFYGSNTYFGSTACVYGLANSSNTTKKTIAFYVTNCDQVRVYLNPSDNSTSSTPAKVAIYECTKNGNSLTASTNPVQSQSYYNTGDAKIFSSELNTSKIYKVELSHYRSRFYEIAFRTSLQQPATIEATPTPLDFDTPAGTSVTKTFTVKGTNLKGDITATLENNVYSINTPTITKAEAETTDGKEVTVTFAPTSAGTFNGKITLTSQDATPVTINLTGVARQPVIVAEPTELSFEKRVGTSVTSVTKTFHVSGTNLAEPITATLSNANGVYSLSTTSVSVEDGTAGTDISVTFNPQAFGTYNGTITLSSGIAAPVVVTLTGKAIDGFDLVITTAGLSTLYLDYPVSIPFDTYPDLLGVFYIYGIGSNGKELLASTLDDIIPANTGVIVQGNANIPEIPTYFFPRISDEEAATYTENSVTSMLKGTTTPIGTQSVESETGKRVYTLGRARNSYINFYHYTGTTLAANKAYLLVEPSTNANAFSILFDGDATSINVVDVNNVDGAWYNLQGVKMQGEPTSKGVFIHNGKKVVVQ